MKHSHDLFQAAKHVIPGGVNSPVRAFNGVGGEPLFIQAAQGAYLTDVDDKHYIDYVGSWGPMIVGHTHPQVLMAIQDALFNGTSFGAPTELEVAMAEKITTLIPSIEMVRMVNSGTEASMSALRLARGYTQRDKVIKFAGCYHGHVDSLLVSAGSGALTGGVPSSAGVSKHVANDTLLADFNDLEQVAELFALHSEQIAAIIVEPIAGNMSCVLPAEGFLQGLRTLCDKYGAVLIFDEVMTGFRVALGGAQSLFDVTPDLTVLGKVIGGGLPVGAFGGKREIMSMLSPLGPVYQAGTLSGNPLAMSAGLATLDLISEPGFHERLTTVTEELLTGLTERASHADIPLLGHVVGGMFGLFFTENDNIFSLTDVMACNTARYKSFFHGMLEQGVYFAPSPFEAGFMSSAHQVEEINLTLEAAECVFASLPITSE